MALEGAGPNAELMPDKDFVRHHRDELLQRALKYVRRAVRLHPSQEVRDLVRNEDLNFYLGPTGFLETLLYVLLRNGLE